MRIFYPIACLFACLIMPSRLGPMITTGFDEIAQTFGVSADQISFSIVGLLQLTTGGGTFFTAAAAAVWGKRPVFIVATIALLGTNAWGFFAGVSADGVAPRSSPLIHHRASSH